MRCHISAVRAGRKRLRHSAVVFGFWILWFIVMVLTRRLGSLRRPQNGDRASGVRTDVPKVRTTISILIDLAIYSAPIATRVRPRGNISAKVKNRILPTQVFLLMDSSRALILLSSVQMLLYMSKVLESDVSIVVVDRYVDDR